MICEHYRTRRVAAVAQLHQSEVAVEPDARELFVAGVPVLDVYSSKSTNSQLASAPCRFSHQGRQPLGQTSKGVRTTSNVECFACCTARADSHSC
jgi:hypothetical protein